MDKVDHYRQHLRQVCDWEPYLLAESRLPGPRANLALVQAAADEGDETQFRRWLTIGADAASSNTPGEFLPVCGAVGLGRLLAKGDRATLPALRAAAADTRWRVREGVAMALQRWGAANMPALLTEMTHWAKGSRYEQRATVAALCEPALLSEPEAAGRVLEILDRIMMTVVGAADRREADFTALCKALGYGWSVAIVAAPERGWALLEKWAAVDDSDTRRIVRENLSKKRMSRIIEEQGRRGAGGGPRAGECILRDKATE
jgi:hypothetical protein